MSQYNKREEVIEYIRSHPGLPALRLRAAFRSNVTCTLKILEELGILESKKEVKGIGRGWEVKCYYLKGGLKNGKSRN